MDCGEIERDGSIRRLSADYAKFTDCNRRRYYRRAYGEWKHLVATHIIDRSAQNAA